MEKLREHKKATLMNLEKISKEIESLLDGLNLDEKVSTINQLKLVLHENSPFKSEPVDCVLWVKNEKVHANDYNPNSVAPPEMLLLEHSIDCDGYTQPVVTALDSDIQGEEINDPESREVVDGFHRTRVGKESEKVKARVKGYLPVVTIRQTQLDRGNRMASTVRHNRARGKHAVSSMSEMVIDLKRRNWSDEKIGKELGMEADEVLRLSQISGLATAFSDKDFSEAWDIVYEEE